MKAVHDRFGPHVGIASCQFSDGKAIIRIGHGNQAAGPRFQYEQPNAHNIGGGCQLAGVVILASRRSCRSSLPAPIQWATIY